MLKSSKLTSFLKWKKYGGQLPRLTDCEVISVVRNCYVLLSYKRQWML